MVPKGVAEAALVAAGVFAVTKVISSLIERKTDVILNCSEEASSQNKFKVSRGGGGGFAT